MLEINLFEEVTQIKMSREVEGEPVYWVAAYLVDGLLIDTGCAYTTEEFIIWLEGQEVHQVVNTHWHEDHIGANRLIQERLGVEIYAHRDSVPLIGRVPELHPYQEFVWGYPEPSRVSVLGDSVDTHRCHFDVLETEGHCGGHVSLLEPVQGWCFSGDIFVNERPKVIREDENVRELIATMKELARLPAERLVLLTSMGEIIPRGREALRSCVGYLENLAQRAAELERAGTPMREIIKELLGRESSLAELTAGHFSSLNLIRGLLKEAPG
jgi:glyoxylase-like metal-dependent hydrolase (beta-lactamase superfamily II)